MRVWLGTTPSGTIGADYLQPQKNYLDARGLVTKGAETVSGADDIGHKPMFSSNNGIREEAELNTCGLAVISAPKKFGEHLQEHAGPKVGFKNNSVSMPCAKQQAQALAVSGSWNNRSLLSVFCQGVRNNAELKVDDKNVDAFSTPCSMREQSNTVPRLTDAYFNSPLNLSGKKEKDEAPRQDNVSVNTFPKECSNQGESSGVLSPQLACQELFSAADVFNASPSWLNNNETEDLFRDAMAIIREEARLEPTTKPQDVVPFLNTMLAECPLPLGSSAMVCTIQVPPIPLTYKERKRKRLLERNRSVKNDVIVLVSSDESDTEIELLQNPRKRPAGPSRVSEPAKPRTLWSCPICFDAKEDVESVMSTKCGHVFCGPCIQSSLKLVKQCPTCRGKLTVRQIHKIYI